MLLYSVCSDWRFSTVCTGAVSEPQVHEHTQLTGVERGVGGSGGGGPSLPAQTGSQRAPKAAASARLS